MLIIQIEDHTSLASLTIYKGMLESLISMREGQIVNEAKDRGFTQRTEAPVNDNGIVSLPISVPAAVAAFSGAIPQPPAVEYGVHGSPSVGYGIHELPQVPPPPVAHIPQPPPAPAFDPATQTAIPGPLVAGVEVDSKGHVWDGRIHAATRAKVADGTWRMKRGIDDATVAAVRAEHAKTQAAPAVSPGMFERAAQPAPAAAFGNPTAVPPPPPVAPTVSTGTIPNTAISLGEPPRLTFPELMRKITAGYAAQKIDKGSVDGALAQLGLPSLPMLARRPDLLHPMASLLGIAS